MGYQRINFWRYALGVAVVSLPAFMLEQEDRGWAWRYVALIVLMMVVTNYEGVARFTAFLQRARG